MILVAVPAAALALLGVLAFLGPVWWAFDLIANFRPQIAVLTTVAGMVLVAGRWRRSGTAALAVAVVNLALVIPLYWGRADVPVDSPGIRVLSFNVFASNDRFGEVIGYVRGVDADVVFIHEASRPWEEAFAEADLPYEVTTVHGEDLIFGTLVLTSPRARVEGFGFSIGEPRAVEVDLELSDGTPVHLLGVHPVAPTTEERALLRDAQMRFAGEWAANQTVPTIVVGDFNASPWSYAFRRVVDVGGLRDSERGFGLQPSFPASGNPLLRVPIDHLLHSDGLVVRDRRLGPALGSDHFPLVVDLALRG